MARAKAQGRMGKKKKTATTNLDPEQKETLSEGNEEVEQVLKTVSENEELLKQEDDAMQIKGL